MRTPVIQPAPPTAPPAGGVFLPEQYHERLREAELMVTYVAQNGLPVEDAVLNGIIGAKNALQGGAWSGEVEVRFWAAFNSLAQCIQPVTLASLEAAASGTSLRSALSRHSVLYYQIGSIAFLLGMLLFQGYWLMGSMLMEDIKNFDQKIAELINQRNNLQNLMSVEQRQDNLELARLSQELDAYFNRRQASYDMLERWKPSNILPKDTDNWGSTPAFAITEIEARFALQSIQLYILPLLYGLLGAFAYVLRSLTSEMKNLTYVSESKVNYRLRLQLGALAGLAIGWFIDPTIAVGSLSPLALAFLAGYSVEVLFSGMDKLIGHLASGEAGRKGAKEAVEEPQATG